MLIAINVITVVEQLTKTVLMSSILIVRYLFVVVRKIQGPYARNLDDVYCNHINHSINGQLRLSSSCPNLVLKLGHAQYA